MSEQQSTEETSTETEAGSSAEDESKTFDADYVAGLRKEAAKYRTEAKAAATALEKQRQASMSEAEKAVAEAERRGRSEAAGEYGKRLATSEIKAVAATEGADLTGVFDYLNLARFVTDDGEPDADAIGKFVAGLPRKGNPAPSFDGGTRQSVATKGDMNSLIRKAAGHG